MSQMERLQEKPANIEKNEMSKTKPSLLVMTLLSLASVVCGQTCNPNILNTAPDSRYTSHGDGTVTDKATGLMWKQCPEGLSGADCGDGGLQFFDWQEALQQGQGLTFAGHSDWRLPNVKELSSLVDRRCADPAINVTLFPFVTPNNWFWSSSPHAVNSYDAWMVGFDKGQVDYFQRKAHLVVRLVRGGQ